MTARLWVVPTRAVWHGVSKWGPVFGPRRPALWSSEVTQAANLTSKTDPKTGPKVGLSRKVRTVLSPTREPRFQGPSLSKVCSFLGPKIIPSQNNHFAASLGPKALTVGKLGPKMGSKIDALQAPPPLPPPLGGACSLSYTTCGVPRP